MTSAGKSFNEAIEFVKKVEGVMRDCQSKTSAMKDKNLGYYQSSYSRGLGRLKLANDQFSLLSPLLHVINYNSASKFDSR